AGRQRRDTDDVHVGLDGLAGHRGGRGELRAGVHVEADVDERGGDHLLPAVVTVLAHLGDQDAGPTTLFGRELLHLLAGRVHVRRVADLVPVHTGDGTNLAGVPAPRLLQGCRDLP